MGADDTSSDDRPAGAVDGCGNCAACRLTELLRSGTARLLEAKEISPGLFVGVVADANLSIAVVPDQTH